MDTATGMMLQEYVDATGSAKMELASPLITPPQSAKPNLEEWAATAGVPESLGWSGTAPSKHGRPSNAPNSSAETRSNGCKLLRSERIARRTHKSRVILALCPPGQFGKTLLVAMGAFVRVGQSKCLEVRLSSATAGVANDSADL